MWICSEEDIKDLYNKKKKHVYCASLNKFGTSLLELLFTIKINTKHYMYIREALALFNVFDSRIVR